jgi:hypothetical protein
VQRLARVGLVQARNSLRRHGRIRCVAAAPRLAVASQGDVPT